MSKRSFSVFYLIIIVTFISIIVFILILINSNYLNMSFRIDLEIFNYAMSFFNALGTFFILFTLFYTIRSLKIQQNANQQTIRSIVLQNRMLAQQSFLSSYSQYLENFDKYIQRGFIQKTERGEISVFISPLRIINDVLLINEKQPKLMNIVRDILNEHEDNMSTIQKIKLEKLFNTENLNKKNIIENLIDILVINNLYVLRLINHIQNIHILISRFFPREEKDDDFEYSYYLEQFLSVLSTAALLTVLIYYKHELTKEHNRKVVEICSRLIPEHIDDDLLHIFIYTKG